MERALRKDQQIDQARHAGNSSSSRVSICTILFSNQADTDPQSTIAKFDVSSLHS